jgi:hypothetical protein
MKAARTTTTVNLDKDLHYQVSIIASKRRSKVGEEIKKAVTRYLNQPSQRKLCMQ